MPSSRFATVLVVVVVALAGCPSLGGGGGASTPTPSAPDHHEIVFASYSNESPFEATVTVTRDGETLVDRTVETGTNGSYAELTTLDEPGPVTVTVNTTIPVGKDDTISDRFEVDADAGNATLVRTDLRGVTHETFPLPRRQLKHPLGGQSSYLNPGGSTLVDLDVRVWYEGEFVASETAELDTDDVTRVVDLNRTGVYYVRARAEGDWTGKVVVVEDKREHVLISVNPQGEIRRINTRIPYEWESR